MASRSTELTLQGIVSLPVKLEISILGKIKSSVITIEAVFSQPFAPVPVTSYVPAVFMLVKFPDPNEPPHTYESPPLEFSSIFGKIQFNSSVELVLLVINMVGKE